MTTNNAAAARSSLRRIVLVAISALLGAGLAGCETGSNVFGSNDQTTALSPPPAAPVASAPQASAKIAIAPVIGAPDAVAKQIAAQLTTSVEKQRITVASASGDKVDYTLRGYIVAARDKAGTKISYIWDVTDPAGKRVNRIAGEEVVAGNQARDPWTAVTPQLVQAIADKTASSLGTWLPSQSQATVAANTSAPAGVGAGAPPATTNSTLPAQPAVANGSQPAATPVSTGSTDRGAVAVVVPSVTGAPGDGSTALTGAIQRELTRSGLGLTDKPTAGSYRVEGRVKMGEAKDGKQPIQIDWDVKDAQGKKLGTVSQKNEVPQGSLDGAWGQTADAAAAAAAQGILKLMPQAKATN